MGCGTPAKPRDIPQH